MNDQDDIIEASQDTTKESCPDKIFDETQPTGGRKFWIRGDESFTEAGQQSIVLRINEPIAVAKAWQPNLLIRGWELMLEPCIHDELPLVAEKYKEFRVAVEVTV
ncbi:hypothetical protein [Enterobacter sp. 03-F-08-SI-ECC]|uniref:hypothetical protein n=1 Tax=Enterobacter sp. 03-F-08-SI-ECC TaxID=3397237 RepID=UPI0039E0EA5A